MKSLYAWGVCVFVACVQPAWGASVTVDAIDRGYFEVTGFRHKDRKNTLSGWISSSGVTLNTRAFFIWDLASVNGQVNSAVLRLELELFSSPASQPIRTIDIYSVTTDPALLSDAYAIGNPTGLSIFSDLETGPTYGATTVQASKVGTVLEINLNADAVNDLGLQQGGLFAVGVKLRNLLLNTANYVRFSDETEPRTHQIVLDVTPPPPAPLLVVPEPTAGQIGLGLLLAVGCVTLARREFVRRIGSAS